jgi:hypothetical protein
MQMQRNKIVLLSVAITLLPWGVAAHAQKNNLDFLNDNKPMLDAHNCYPYEGKWQDRVSRALNSGFPVSIEQDLAWYSDPTTGRGRVVVSHTPKTTGQEPTLKAYFFDQVKPVVEKIINENKLNEWPLIVLHFDFKDNQPALHEGVWNLLREYEPWISTAVKTSDPHKLSPIQKKPILVITEDNDAQEKVFFDHVPVGSKLLIFGSAHSGAHPDNLSRAELAHWEATASPETLLTETPTNYRRWWNNSWAAIEEGGQHNAGEWTPQDEQRLHNIVERAHNMGYWIRFYTLDGFDPQKNEGWGAGYNFGSRDAVLPRWKAAISEGVNFIATDQYEDFATLLPQTSKSLRPGNTH